MDGNFSYKASARLVGTSHLYRDETDPTKQYCNIVVDPRIYRGSTYARRAAMTEQVTKIESYRGQSRSRSIMEEESHQREGFIEALVQTDEFDGTVIVERKESHVAIQTDPFTEKPIVHKKPTPLKAVSIKTDIPGTVLFDFEIEVQPFVTTLVQKAITQASMEVHEEEELANMNRYLKAFEQNAKVEQQAINRLEEAENKKYQEKERILAERLEIENKQLEMKHKVFARGFAEWYVWDIADDVVKHLEKTGYFYDEINREIETQFMPFMHEKVKVEAEKRPITLFVEDRLREDSIERYNQEVNNMIISKQIEKDRAEMYRDELLRKMIAEDVVSRAIRLSKAIKKKHQKDHPEEEEGNEEETSATGTGTESTYEYSEV